MLLFKNRWLNVSSMVVLNLMISLACGTILELIGGSDIFFNSNQKEEFLIREIAIFILMAPLIETLVFQFALIEFLQKFLQFNYKIVIIVSALLFGLSHHYNLYYIVATFVSGIIYSYSYVFFKEAYGKKFAFYSVFVIHSVKNSIALVEDLIT